MNGMIEWLALVVGVLSGVIGAEAIRRFRVRHQRRQQPRYGSSYPFLYRPLPPMPPIPPPPSGKRPVRR
jgi:hypothetical protein